MSNHTVVVHPELTEDVTEIVKITAKYRMPVTPYSGGSSLERNFRAIYATPVFVPFNYLTVIYSTSGKLKICFFMLDQSLSLSN